jgi:hypothetical protein
MLVEIAYDRGFANGHGVGNQVGFVAGVMSLKAALACGLRHGSPECGKALESLSASGSTSEKKYGSCADRATHTLLQVISLLSFMIEAQGSGASAVGQQPQGVEDDQQCGALMDCNSSTNAQAHDGRRNQDGHNPQADEQVLADDRSRDGSAPPQMGVA